MNREKGNIQDNLVFLFFSSMAVQHQETRTIAVPQIQVHTENSSVQFVSSEVQQAAASEELSSDHPRILYQCGDCDEVFKSLDLWQHHRKEGTCQEAVPGSKSNPDSQPEPEASSPQCSTSILTQEEASLSESDASKNVKPEQAEQPVAEEEWQWVDQTSSAQNPETPVSEAVASTSNAEDSSPKRRGANKKVKPEPVLLCVDCGSCFGLVSELVAHRKTHGFEEALHHCSVCGESFLNTTLFLYHRKQHKQKDEEKAVVVPAVTTEEVCAQSNGTDEQGQDVLPSAATVVSSFTQPELFMCILCGESFSDEAGLVTHRKGSHDLQEPLHSCSHCGENFMNTTQYLYHRRQHSFPSGIEVADGAETGEETVTTTPQDTPQSSKRLLSSPAAANEPGSPFPKRSRPSIRILSSLSGNKGSGSREESEGSAAADLDNTNLPPPAKLMHDWARTPLPHVCPYCGKTFTRRVFLRSHVYSHTGEKLFTCKVPIKT